MNIYTGIHVQYRSKAFLLILILLILSIAGESRADERLLPYVEKHANGWIDWDKGLIYGIGQGFLSKNNNSKPRALGAAQLLASASIVKLAAGIHLDDQNTLETIGGAP